ncbi:DUF3035 domain-containing protein [Acidisoma silvae]|uniref:DUF3035 domain-containing protein n=1 Tax=Acidisoma silvae TaxID=2802396 RepID=A0A963YN49_9PROT|nr:DUF3035 domain-containing protein [Acidisoma silvae]MCB8873564.1 DUF3035 domain-containing protein [Acidisoma silvae]
MRWTLFVAPLMLAGCSSGTMQTLGLQRDPPDEFLVTTQSQLSMPPDLNSAAADLPAPTPGAPRPQEVTIPVQAESAMLGGASLAGGAPNTAGDQAFVGEAGPAAPANIRQQIDVQAVKDAKSQTLGNRLDPFGRPVAKPALVDAKGEAQRLQKNAALGLSPANGSTPLVKPKSHGPLGDLLDKIF